ncbi:MAG: hypothetical protein EOO46_17610, partial [Flavobacterium sp.]
MKKNSDENGFYQFDNYSQYFFEDENYSVTKECRGEFGGYVYFKDKSDDKTYCCYADCAVTLIKQNGIYYLTTSIAHMIGFYGIYEITNPKQLIIKESDAQYYSEKELSVGMKPLCYGMKKTIL